MAIVKRIEGNTVHKIQSGQVVVDLCSAVKELVENAIDAGATSIDVRFKNYGLEAIEVQDNGSGIAKDDFESIALKHYTSKLNTYDDLESLSTYGFRGEALSSLCAVSDLHITTAREDEAPKGCKLDFEFSGKLKSTTIIACQRGTTVYVTDIFRNLIVRRRELEKNIKREYTKVLNLLQAYACICTGVRLSVSNTVAKQKKDAFRTRGGQTTKDNIANVFGTKTLAGLIPMDLKFEMTSSNGIVSAQQDSLVQVVGHISAPVFGGGRQISDRQMFFVNSRPCSLPQFAKVFNEVYKSYNMSQSPFVFANIVLDTSAYDVNVSPDKRTILLHDQSTMLDSIRTTLVELFEDQQHSVPQATTERTHPSYRPLTISRETTMASSTANTPSVSRTTTADSQGLESEEEATALTQKSINLISKFAARGTTTRIEEKPAHLSEKQKARLKLDEGKQRPSGVEEYDDVHEINQQFPSRETDTELDETCEADNIMEPALDRGAAAHVQAFNERLAELEARDRTFRVRPTEAVGNTANDSVLGSKDNADQQATIPSTTTSPVKDVSGAIPNAFDRMRPHRTPLRAATVTVGDKTTTTIIGARTSSSNNLRRASKAVPISLKAFMAPGTQADNSSDSDDDEASQEADANDSIIKLPRRIAAITAGQQVILDDTGGPVSDASETGNGSDDDYIDEETKKARENERVSQLIEEAEAHAALPSQENMKRAKSLLGENVKEATLRLSLKVAPTMESIAQQFEKLTHLLSDDDNVHLLSDSAGINDPKAESHLSITVSKSDFSKMRIIGQFNLGFIVAVRPKVTSSRAAADEMFIIDQHASDEKYNFERLQRTTILQNQRLVQPQTLDLTAVEEEILTNNTDALQANGFQIAIDESGAAQVGQRCTLHALPTSREVTFTTTDLEELLSLLAVSEDGESHVPTSTMSLGGRYIPRPSKVRKLFAMRACRSSIMIGKTLTKVQMEKLVGNMGTIDKPWNCPHGRPTMRHLRTLQGVKEWMGQRQDPEEEDSDESIDWDTWLKD